jgi:predicted ATPase
MIKEIRLSDFKSFANLDVELSKLTVLTGLNSSGKSSLIQAMRLLREQGPFEEFDSLKDFIRNDRPCLEVSAVERFSDTEEIAQCQVTRDNAMSENSVPLRSRYAYLSAGRLGPMKVLSFNDERVTSVGSKGEKIIDFLYAIDNDERLMTLKVPSALRVNEQEAGIKANLNAWLGKVSPGVEFDYVYEKVSHAGWTLYDGRSAIQVGFGLSFDLPVVLSLLVYASAIGILEERTIPVLLIENPEAHMHPSGQTALGRLLAAAASCGLQIIVETHSDHLVNGIRIAVKEELLKASEARFLYFYSVLDEAGFGAKHTEVEDITVDDKGMLDYWPEGFFDQTEKNLMALL